MQPGQVGMLTLSPSGPGIIPFCGNTQLPPPGPGGCVPANKNEKRKEG